MVTLAPIIGRSQLTQPIVAIHDSELTRFLDSSNAPAVAPTPTGPGTTGLQWWNPRWHYFVMPETVKEALRSDGTTFTVIGDSNIVSGLLLTNGQPRFPIVISLASEAIRDDEIAQFTNYVAAGGFLLVGSSSFTRNTNGTSRGDFAFANELGLHMAFPALTNWAFNNNLTKQGSHRLTAHLPDGALTWRMPTAAEEIPWGISPNHPFLAPHDIWRVNVSDATVVAQGDSFPFLTVKRYGKGCFIYHCAFQPLMGHSGFAPSMYAYMLFRNSIEWAFESFNQPVPKLSPWPFPYDAAMMARHDLENFTNFIANVASSAQFEFTNGAKGDYYFCTGTIRDDVQAPLTTNAVIANLRQAVTNYGASIGPHNGGLKNPYNTNLVRGDYDYWHWGPDEVLDFTPTNFANGKAYAFASLSNSFTDIEGWLSGITNGARALTGCYFNANREDSYDIQAKLGVQIAGDQKISPFPQWTISTVTSGKRYPFLSQPVSDWFVGGLVAQSLEPWHPPGVHTVATLHDAVDFYYNLGALIALYSHSLSTGIGDAGQLAPEYIRYTLNTNLHPRVWAANALGIYQWWTRRSNALVTATFSTNGFQSVASLAISGAVDTNSAVEMVIPASGSAFNTQVFTNSVLAGTNIYRSRGQTLKIFTGTSVTNAEIRYYLGPRAVDDTYSASSGRTLNVSAPGVLANDGPGMVGGLVTTVVTGPANGSLVLGTNGAFSYTPSPGFLGHDTFTYQVSDAQTNTSTASVSILVLSSDVLFVDDFTRPADPGPLAPWIVQAGSWAVTGGAMRSGTNALNNYANAYITNSWTNYAVQARLRFQAGGFGGGLGGRLNTANGAHYAAWIYQENSPGGSNMLKLVKFQGWTSFGYLGVGGNFMAQTSLASVGTNYHTVKLAFHGNRIAVYFDGVQRISVTDLELQPYASGGLSLDMWTDTIGYLFNADDVTVTPLVMGDNYATTEESPLVVPATGVLTNDTAVYGASLSPVVLTGPAHGSVNLSADGGFTYTPVSNYYGADAFIYQANDGLTNVGSATVSISIAPVNHAPVLPAQSDRSIAELTPLTVTNTATDVDVPANNLSYILINPPTGAAITTNGIITWTPTETEGPSTNVIMTVVTDDGSPPMSATNSFIVVVTTVNSAPVLPAQSDQTMAEMTLLSVTNTASDPDIPANALSYALVNPPTGAAIDTNGIITWTPSEAQGPGTNLITTIVTDNGSPPLSATNTFKVVVTEVNSAPVLPVQTNRTTAELTSLTVTNTATDSDVPVNALTYTLVNPPTGAVIDASGIITWAPSETQGPSTNVITTIVTDNGSPPLRATNSFTVVVTEANTAPVLSAQTNRTIAELTLLTVTNSATDSDVPANLLTYTLIDPPAGASIDTNGVITWTPSEAQGPGTNLITTVVTDNGTPPMSATNSFTVVVTEVNSAPLLASQSDRTIAELTLLTVTNTATDPDIPLNTLTYTLVNPPTGTVIDATGVITWTPSETQGPSTNIITTIATDNCTPPLSVTNSFTVVVTEANSAPVLSAQTNHTIAELTLLTVTNSATDSDIPANVLTYTLIDPPAGASIDTNGIITWTPSEAQGPGTNLITTVVTDNGSPPLSATNSFTVVVEEVNSAPLLASQSDLTIAELSSLTVTNTAIDSDIPTNVLSYLLLDPPVGASIDTNGVITWTPSEAKGPGTNLITTVVTDNGTPPLSATNSFTVVVTEMNSAPVLPPQSDRTITELTLLTVTNTATDVDMPANTLTYTLLNPPTGAVIDATGVITWTPSETQGPSTNVITTIVNDDGSPPLSATNSFKIVVTEANGAPVLSAQTNRTIAELTLLTVTNSATDSDIPANVLTYTLIDPPAGASIDTNGVITWTPSEAQGPGTNLITTVVTDNGSPPLSATNSFTVVVTEVNSAPVLSPQSDHTIAELTFLTVTNAATDPDIPANALTYMLLNPPTGASINTNGVITWTPSEAQGPGTNLITTVVTDNGTPPMSATNSFTVVVEEVNSAPRLPLLVDLTIDELTTLSVTNTAVDHDLPANTLSYSLLNSPIGAGIDANGVITWTPSEAQGPGTYSITTVVTDDGIPPRSATNSFSVTIREVNSAPVLPLQTNRTIMASTLLMVTNAATDTDVPMNVLTYTLSQAPSGAEIDTNGVITWTPSPDKGGTTNVFETTVTDGGQPPLSATNSFLVMVSATPSPPLIQSLELASGSAVITWSSVPGQTYRLQYQDTLGDSSWTNVEPDIPATASSTTATNVVGDLPQRFYRVLMLP